MAKDDEEIPASGTPIEHRNETAKRSFAFGEPDSIEAISDHVEKHVGKIDYVLHETISELIHVDVHHVPPSLRYPFHSFVTTGMSEKPMKTGNVNAQFAELVILLPREWQLSVNLYAIDSSLPLDQYWPVQLLKELARFPHQRDTWLGIGHTVENFNAKGPYAPGTKFCGALLFPPVSLPRDFRSLVISKNKSINFFAIYPLYREELELKLEKGLSWLLTNFKQHGILDVVDNKRPNVGAATTN